ncbi:MAG: hypothetical protein E6K52_02745 [Gammaproteobacteria bacterium]|nr:MAG: hypothetical protein E6K52_02745 [Gammaproteobacteria bacterium]
MHTDLERMQRIAQRLLALPGEEPPPYDWDEFKRRTDQQIEPRTTGVNERYAAIAAALVVLIAGAAVWSRLTRSDASSHMHESQLAHVRAATVEGDVNSDTRVEVGERWLASLPKEPVVVRVGTRAAVGDLEDRIAQVDDLLTDETVDGARPARLHLLEQERARLVNSLVQVRYAETLAAASR